MQTIISILKIKSCIDSSFTVEHLKCCNRILNNWWAASKFKEPDLYCELATLIASKEIELIGIENSINELVKN